MRVGQKVLVQGRVREILRNEEGKKEGGKEEGNGNNEGNNEGGKEGRNEIKIEGGMEGKDTGMIVKGGEKGEKAVSTIDKGDDKGNVDGKIFLLVEGMRLLEELVLPSSAARIGLQNDNNNDNGSNGGMTDEERVNNKMREEMEREKRRRG